MKKRIAAAVLAIMMAVVPAANSFALTDARIFTDPVQATYTGRPEALQLQDNLRFSDLPYTHWAYEAVMRAGTLNMVKGYSKRFNPTSSVSNAEALAFAVRIMGLEDTAQAKGAEMITKGTLPQGLSALPTWMAGYLSVAYDNGLLTDAEYNATLVEDQTTLLDTDFHAGLPATRERVADWVVKALEKINANAFKELGTQQGIYKFSDWQTISGLYTSSAEKCVKTGIIQGKNGKFEPRSSLTRAEMAQILSNMDSIYNDVWGLEKKYGVVGGIKEGNSNETGSTEMYHDLYIRNNDGNIDVLRYTSERNSSPQAATKDAVVLYGNRITGLGSIQQGDEIQYLVDKATNTLMFVKLTSELTISEQFGTLEKFNSETGQIEIRDPSGVMKTFYVADGFYGYNSYNDTNFLVIDGKEIAEKNIPFGQKISAQVKNNTIDEIKFVGQPTISNELRGIVIENNSGLGYLTIIDNNGNEVTKNYYENEMIVEKQQYYDDADEIGYYDQVYNDFRYDPRDCNISEIEPGDIVYIKTYVDDPNAIESISASTNYIMKYGKVSRLNNTGDMTEILVTYENGQTAWFDAANSIFISKGGKPIKMSELTEGDWVKLLVNDAIISPGYVMESVKEIKVENSGHDISMIIKGSVGAINGIQRSMSIQNAYSLTKDGWSNYSQIKQLSLENNDIKYFYEGKQVSLDYVEQFLKRADGDVYVALENNYAGEKVSMVSFRSSRGDVMDSDTIVSTDGGGGFSTVSNVGVKTDQGTIIRRYGRLVDGSALMIPDYAQVVLNADNMAAVVDIYDAPAITGLMIARGRILSVDEGKSFKVKSMSSLEDVDWIYTPVEREFVIDHETVFIDETGVVSSDSFKDYTADTAVNSVYNIIADGTKALYVIKAPFSRFVLRGELAEEPGTNSLLLKDGIYYNNDNGIWSAVSNVDNSINITTAPNTVVIKSNKVIDPSKLEKGDKIKVLTSTLPELITGGMTMNGYIILVES